MSRKLAHLYFGLLGVLGCCTADADTSWGLSPQWTHSSDSDGLVINKWSAQILPVYQSGLDWKGIDLQQQRYRQRGAVREGQSINYSVQHTDAISGMGHSYKLGVSQGASQSLVTADLNWNQALTEQIQWGIYASRDWVESMSALEHNVHYDLIGGSLDYQLHPRITLVGALTHTRFSDEQDREQLRTRAVWDVWPEHGVTLQWSQKYQQGGKESAQRLYFNPKRLDEYMGFVGWRQRYEGWQIYTRLGYGQQHVINDPTTPSRLAELQLSSPANGTSFFKLRTGHSETFGLNGPGYVYRYIDVQWIVRLNR